MLNCIFNVLELLSYNWFITSLNFCPTKEQSKNRKAISQFPSNTSWCVMFISFSTRYRLSIDLSRFHLNGWVWLARLIDLVKRFQHFHVSSIHSAPEIGCRLWLSMLWLPLTGINKPLKDTRWMHFYLPSSTAWQCFSAAWPQQKPYLIFRDITAPWVTSSWGLSFMLIDINICYLAHLLLV